MAEKSKTNLKDIIKNIQNQELLLPDFQRGFVWDLDKQKRLVASVLARMPLGSILILNANADDYGCRILGRKEHVELEKNKKVDVLLDGQQRLTVLTNIFSNLLYYNYKEEGILMQNYRDIISKDLKYRFFLRIPCIEKLKEKEDLFGLRNLKFALNNPDRKRENVVKEPENSNVFPDFLTEDIIEYIEIRAFDKQCKKSYAPHSEEPLNIIIDAVKQLEEENYMIPLYLFVDNGIKRFNTDRALKEILKAIVRDVVRYKYNTEYEKCNTKQEKEEYIRKTIENDIYCKEIIKDKGIDEDKFIEKWVENGYDDWGEKFKNYINVCITCMNLHEITVPESERKRAIDIYENLNLGGITLSTFELILAKASKIKFKNDSNLYEEMLNFMNEPKNYDRVILTESVESYFEEFQKENPEYSATKFMECYDKNKHEFRQKYTDVFLDVLSLLCYVPDYNPQNIEVNLLKRDKILNLSAEQIHDNYKKACIGIDRGCFFLQARGGARKIQEINYNLMLVLLGYILANEEYYKNKKIINRLEAWYWSSIFSGRYDKDQTSHLKEDIEFFLKDIKEGTDKFGWLEDRRDNMFMIRDFSDEKTILMETYTTPKTVLRTSICQFYLAQTYSDLLEKELLNPFCKEVKELQGHHIIPVSRMNLKDEERLKAREDKTNIINSPVNFAYILKDTNKKISNQVYEQYQKYCKENSIFGLNLSKAEETLEDEQIREILRERLGKTKTEIQKRINNRLGVTS